MNLHDWLPSDSRGVAGKVPGYGISRLSIHCPIGAHPPLSCHPPVPRTRPQPIRGLAAIQCGNIGGACGRASANQRPSCSRVWRILLSASWDPYKLRCVSASESVLEYLWLRTLQADAVGSTPAALTLRFTGKEASSRSSGCLLQ